MKASKMAVFFLSILLIVFCSQVTASQKGKDGKAIPYQVRQLLEFIAANHLIDENVEQ